MITVRRQISRKAAFSQTRGPTELLSLNCVAEVADPWEEESPLIQRHKQRRSTKQRRALNSSQDSRLTSACKMRLEPVMAVESGVTDLKTSTIRLPEMRAHQSLKPVTSRHSDRYAGVSAQSLDFGSTLMRHNLASSRVMSRETDRTSLQSGETQRADAKVGLTKHRLISTTALSFSDSLADSTDCSTVAGGEGETSRSFFTARSTQQDLFSVSSRANRAPLDALSMSYQPTSSITESELASLVSQVNELTTEARDAQEKFRSQKETFFKMRFERRLRTNGIKLMPGTINKIELPPLKHANFATIDF